MNLTLAQLVDILQDVGIAHRDGHPLSTGRADVPNGITLSLEQDIDLTERLERAVVLLNRGDNNI